MYTYIKSNKRCISIYEYETHVIENSIKLTDLCKIITYENENINKIDINFDKFSKHNYKLLSNVLHNKNIYKLSIYCGNEYGYELVYRHNFKKICKDIKMNNTLTDLRLSNMLLTTSSLKWLANSIRFNNNLKQINWGNIYIVDSKDRCSYNVIYWLSYILKHNKYLQKLTIYGEMLIPSNIKLLINSLKKNTTLSAIVFTLSDEFEYFDSLVVKNIMHIASRFKELGFDGCLTEQDMKYVCKQVRINKNINCLHLMVPDYEDETKVWKYIIKMLMYGHLEKLSMCTLMLDDSNIKKTLVKCINYNPYIMNLPVYFYIDPILYESKKIVKRNIENSIQRNVRLKEMLD